MKKRSFLLLEVLIAFTLATICSIPLVKQPLRLYKEEITFLVKMERERLADWTFTEIKEILLKNEIAWEKLPQMGKNTAPFPLPPALIEIPGCRPKKVERTFILHGQGEKPGTSNQLYRQIYVRILLDDQEYEFRLPVQKLSRE